MVAKRPDATLKIKKQWAYHVFFLEQRPAPAPKLIMFYAPVKEILEWAKVEWLTPKKQGPQREQKEAKVAAISNFLSVEKTNTIPTALVIAFAKGATKVTKVASSGANQMADLSIEPSGNAIASVVDGQHRLYGMNEFDPSICVPILGILDADRVERAFQFLIINNKATKVPTTHTKALLAEMASTNLAKRLKEAKVSFDAEGIRDVDLVNSDPDSPFFNSIEWTTTPKNKRIVQATAIEFSLDYLGGLGIQELDDRDVCRSVFLSMWKTIKRHWPKLWKPKSRLISKVGIMCLTRFLSDRISSWSDNDELKIRITDLAQIEKLTEQLIGKMDDRFWTTEWAESARGGFDTAQGRERVLAAITQLYRNGQKGVQWYTNIEIINKAAASK